MSIHGARDARAMPTYPPRQPEPVIAHPRGVYNLLLFVPPGREVNEHRYSSRRIRHVGEGTPEQLNADGVMRRPPFAERIKKIVARQRKRHGEALVYARVLVRVDKLISTIRTPTAERPPLGQHGTAFRWIVRAGREYGCDQVGKIVFASLSMAATGIVSIARERAAEITQVIPVIILRERESILMCRCK